MKLGEKINKLITTIKQKNYLIIAIPFVLILLFIVFSLLLFQTESPPTKQGPQRIPTKAIVDQQKQLGVTSFSPVHGARNISAFTSITVTFIDPIPTTQQTTIKLSLTPSIEGKQTWSEDRKTVIYTPINPLETEASYTATLTRDEGSASWTFTTASFNDSSSSDQEKLEEIRSQNVVKAENEFFQKYPWYNNLPLESENYFVYLDTEKGILVGLIYPDPSSSTPIDTQVNSMKQEITNRLNSVGINTTQNPMTWEVNQ